MGARHSNQVGHDSVTNENKTHIELNTRRVYAKTAGFRLFDIHNEGSGRAHTGILAGVSGIGIVGEVLLGLCVLALLIKLLKRWQEKKVRHENYKAYYRAQAAAAGTSIRHPLPAIQSVRTWSEPERTRKPQRKQQQREHTEINVNLDTE